MKVKLLILFIFLAINIGFGSLLFKTYEVDTAISSEPVFVTAQIVNHDTASRFKRGVETVDYKIHYKFKVNNVTYHDKITLINESGASAVNQGKLKLVYKKSDPKVHKLKRDYKSNRTLGNLIWKFVYLFLISLVMAPLFGLVSAVKLGLIKENNPNPAKEAA